jgi:hypothetical protein
MQAHDMLLIFPFKFPFNNNTGCKTRIITRVDAFAYEPFKGNPAGVMIVSKDRTAVDAKYNIRDNLSETAFVIPGIQTQRVGVKVDFIAEPIVENLQKGIDVAF